MITYSIVYSSKTGNTKLLADQIAAVMQSSQMTAEQSNQNELSMEPKQDATTMLAECIYYGPADPKAFTADLIFCGFWTDKGRCDDAIMEFLEQCEHKKLFLFGTAGFGGESTYFEQILNRVKAYVNDSNQIIGSFMCQGKMPQAVKSRYEQMLAANPEDAKAKMLIANFDQALTHPDNKELECLKETIKEVFKKMQI